MLPCARRESSSNWKRSLLIMIRLSFSELSVIRSLGKLMIPLTGIGLILVTLYAGTVWMERILTHKDDLTEKIPTVSTFVDATGEWHFPDSEYQFPYRTRLESADGRQLEALLLGRPDDDEIIFQRTSDNRVFSLEFDELSAGTQDLLSEFPASGRPFHELELFRMIYPDLPVHGSGLPLPHDCTIVSSEGQTLPVTLLARPSGSEVTLQRKIDGRVFTIPLSRLIPSDREFIRLFASGNPAEPTESVH